MFKGSTTSDKYGASGRPGKLSRGYAYKDRDQADSRASQRWEVVSFSSQSYFVTAEQGDSIMLSVSSRNGDHHEVPAHRSGWREHHRKDHLGSRREYTAFFQARKVVQVSARL